MTKIISKHNKSGYNMAMIIFVIFIFFTGSWSLLLYLITIFSVMSVYSWATKIIIFAIIFYPCKYITCYMHKIFVFKFKFLLIAELYWTYNRYLCPNILRFFWISKLHKKLHNQCKTNEEKKNYKKAITKTEKLLY